MKRFRFSGSLNVDFVLQGIDEDEAYREAEAFIANLRHLLDSQISPGIYDKTELSIGSEIYDHDEEEEEILEIVEVEDE